MIITVHDTIRGDTNSSVSQAQPYICHLSTQEEEVGGLNVEVVMVF